MTAKQALLEAVVELNEDDALRLLQQIRYEQAVAAVPLAPDEVALIRKALANEERRYSVEEIEQEFVLGG